MRPGRHRRAPAPRRHVAPALGPVLPSTDQDCAIRFNWAIEALRFSLSRLGIAPFGTLSRPGCAQLASRPACNVPGTHDTTREGQGGGTESCLIQGPGRIQGIQGPGEGCRIQGPGPGRLQKGGGHVWTCGLSDDYVMFGERGPLHEGRALLLSYKGWAAPQQVLFAVPLPLRPLLNPFVKP